MHIAWTIQMKDATAKRKDSEIQAKSRALDEKEVCISAFKLGEQLSKVRLSGYYINNR